jgi:Holliday junction resolvase RusA-like endonuclease
MQVTFTVPGKPIGKGRPRFYAGHAVTPEKTRDYEKMTAMLYSVAAKDFIFPADSPLRVSITAYYPIPARTPKSKRAEMLDGGAHATKKPDADNVAKIILDALNGTAYEDDAQVVQLSVRKQYGAEPCVRVSVENI